MRPPTNCLTDNPQTHLPQITHKCIYLPHCFQASKAWLFGQQLVITPILLLETAENHLANTSLFIKTASVIHSTDSGCYTYILSFISDHHFSSVLRKIFVTPRKSKTRENEKKWKWSFLYELEKAQCTKCSEWTWYICFTDLTPTQYTSCGYMCLLNQRGWEHTYMYLPAINMVIIPADDIMMRITRYQYTVVTVTSLACCLEFSHSVIINVSPNVRTTISNTILMFVVLFILHVITILNYFNF